MGKTRKYGREFKIKKAELISFIPSLSSSDKGEANISVNDKFIAFFFHGTFVGFSVFRVCNSSSAELTSILL